MLQYSKNLQTQSKITFLGSEPERFLKIYSPKFCFVRSQQDANTMDIANRDLNQRLQLLEEVPISSRNDDPVNFDTAMIPWWVWTRRFHMPEAEKANGRAAMIGYFSALLVDKLWGVGLIDQQSS